MRKRKRGKTLGWLGFFSLFIWLYYDYTKQISKAIVSGWVSIALTLAHIYA